MTTIEEMTMSAPHWDDFSTGELVTGDEAAELVSQRSEKPIVGATWRSYQRRWADQGLIPGPVRRIGRIPLYDAGQVIEWTNHRLGRGNKSHIVKTDEATDTKPTA